MESNLITVKEAMDICKVGRETVLRWIEHGDIDAAKIGDYKNSKFLVNVESLNNFMRSGDYPGKPESILSNEPFRRVPDIEDCYPMNLFAKMFGNDVEDPDNMQEFDYWHIDIPAFRKLFGTLTDREQKIIEMRFHLGLTLEEVGKTFGIGKERIRLIQNKAVRKLRTWIVRDGCYTMTKAKYDELRHEIDKLIAENTALMKKLEDHEAEQELREAVENRTVPLKVDLIKVEDMDLSVRAYNCIKRAGINTVGDVMRYDQTKDWRRVRNLGRKSLEEIATKVYARYGFRIRYYDPDHKIYDGYIPVYGVENPVNLEIQDCINKFGEVNPNGGKTPLR